MCDSFPTLMEQVLNDIRADTNAARRQIAVEEEGGVYKAETDERDKRAEREVGGLEIPKVVMEEGVRITRECLEMVVEVRP